MARKFCGLVLALGMFLIGACDSGIGVPVEIDPPEGAADVRYELSVLQTATTCASLSAEALARDVIGSDSSLLYRDDFTEAGAGFLWPEEGHHVFSVVGRAADMFLPACDLVSFGCTDVTGGSTDGVMIALDAINWAGHGNPCWGFRCSETVAGQCLPCASDDDCDEDLIHDLFTCDEGTCRFEPEAPDPVTVFEGQLGDHLAFAISSGYLDLGVVFEDQTIDLFHVQVEEWNERAAYSGLMEDTPLSTYFELDGHGIALSHYWFNQTDYTLLLLVGKGTSDPTTIGIVGTIEPNSAGLDDATTTLTATSSAMPAGQLGIIPNPGGTARYVFGITDTGTTSIVSYRGDGTFTSTSSAVTESSVDYLAVSEGGFVAFPDPEDGQDIYSWNADEDSPESPELGANFGPRVGSSFDWSYSSENDYTISFPSEDGVTTHAVVCDPADSVCGGVFNQPYIYREITDADVGGEIDQVQLLPIEQTQGLAWVERPDGSEESILYFALLDDEDRMLGDVLEVFRTSDEIIDYGIGAHRLDIYGVACAFYFAILLRGDAQDAIVIKQLDMGEPSCV